MPQPSATERPLTSCDRLWIGTALVCSVAVCLFIYWPGVHGGFVMDDFPNIVRNAAVHITSLNVHSLLAAAFSSHSGPLDRPLSMITFALNEYFWGPSPFSMKVTNILIHACNGLLVYAVAGLILRVYRQRFAPELSESTVRWTAVATATAWMLLPINLTAVLYIVQRMTSLSGTFVLAGIALYLWGRLRMLAGRRGFWMLWAGIVPCGILAVLAKEIGALLPVYALIIEWTLFGFQRADGRRDRRLYALYALVLALPAALGLAWLGPQQLVHGAYAGRPFTLGERLLTEPRVILDYILWSLVPNPHVLSLYHDDYPFSRSLLKPPTTLFAIVGIALLLATAIWQRRRRPLLSLGILWFFGGQLLTGTIFNLELVYEHRNYLPSLGLLLALFSTLLLARPRVRLPLARPLVVVGLIALYAGITAMRVQQWANPVRYAVISAAEHPHSPRATYGLGEIYAVLVDGPDSRFLPIANKALEKAAVVRNSNILPEQGLLLINAKEHRPVKASWWNTMNHKLATRPASPQDVSALYALVHCEVSGTCRFDDKQMARTLNTAVRRNPDNANLLTIYSNFALNVLHDADKARKMMVRAAQKAPTDAQYWVNLVELDVALGRFRDAQREIERVTELDRFGNLDSTVDRLRSRLANARKQGSSGTSTTAPAPYNPALH